VQGQHAALEQLRAFVQHHKQGQVCLLYGLQGVGKTSMVTALARDLGAELIEVNASDVRNEEAIMQRVGPALKQQSLFAKTKILLFDEADGLSGTNDRGGIGAILRLAKETPYPIIMTANDPWSQKFADLRRSAVLVQARSLAYTSIVPVLRRIARSEGVDAEEEALKVIARRAGGDLRAAITDLHSLGSPVSVDKINSLSERNVNESIFNAVRVVLKTKDPRTARHAFDTIAEDIDEIFLWIDENLPKEYRKPHDLRRAYERISLADVYRGRILRWQHWRFLVYCYDLLGPGVALAKEEKYEGFTNYSRTERLFAIWRSKSTLRDSIVAKLAAAQHTSKRAARRELRILRKTLQEWPALSEDEREWLQR
jgi:replication factor C large subunit